MNAIETWALEVAAKDDSRPERGSVDGGAAAIPRCVRGGEGGGDRDPLTSPIAP